MSVTYYGNPNALRYFLRSIPAILGGRLPDAQFAQDIRVRLGVALLSQIQQDFLTKAQGGRGRDGIQWKPLSPYTIARRRIGAKDKKLLTIKARTMHLTAAERREYQKEYRQKVKELVQAGLPRDKASFQARASVARKLKRKGYPVLTNFDILSARQVEILRDTGELFNSLSPGFENVQSHAPGQIFEEMPGKVTVGTNKKPWHHTTTGSGRLPRRPYWPDNGLPPSWARALLFAAQIALRRHLEAQIQQRRFR